MIDSNTNQEGKVRQQYKNLSKIYDAKFSKFLSVVTQKILERANLKPRDKILDIGCGTGELLFKMRAKEPHADFTGVDVSPDMVEQAKKKLGPGVYLDVGTVNHLRYPNNHFNLVTMSGMIHYLDFPTTAFREVYRITAAGGHVIAVDMASDFMLMKLGYWFRRIFNPSAIHLYSLKEIITLFESTGFTVTHSKVFRAGIFGLYLVEAKK